MIYKLHFIVLLYCEVCSRTILNANEILKNVNSEEKIRLKRSVESMQADDQFLKCKLTPNAIDYVGIISTSKNLTNEKNNFKPGEECIFWNSPQVSKVIELNDLDFPEGSVQKARKYCRNPDNSNEPWCFNSKLEKKVCAINYCVSSTCRISGPGLEYQGKSDKSMYGNICKHWVSNDLPRDIVGTYFPESHPSKAHNFCRNPTNDIAGPYCYVNNLEQLFESNGSVIMKEYCLVPFCDLFELGLYNPSLSVAEEFASLGISVVNGHSEDKYYTHFTKFVTEKQQLTFDLKLWSPSQIHESEIRIVISALPVPVDSDNLRSWEMGFEVVLSMNRSGVTPTSKEDISWTETPQILTGSHWVNLTMQWGLGFISLKNREDEENSAPLFIYSFTPKENSIFALSNSTLYYSLVGSPMFFIQNITNGSPSNCDEHITTREDYTRYFPLVHEYESKIMNFYIKSYGNCGVLFRMSPIQATVPDIKLILSGTNGGSYLTLRWPNNTEESLGHFSFHLLSYTTWTHIIIKIAKNRFQLFVDAFSGMNVLLDVINTHFNILQWFSIGSNSTSFWHFRCEPNVTDSKSEDCSVSTSGKGYSGRHWITKTGQPCLPWVAKYARKDEQHFDIDGSIEEAINYCRNTNNNDKGAFCYVYNIQEDMKVHKELCDVPKCVTCRKSGIGTDFDSPLNFTVSNRKCQFWNSDEPHLIPKSLKSKHLFPEQNLNHAQNFCRDPTADIAGPWCYTTDPNVPYESCNVNDCDRPHDCTMYLTGISDNKILLSPKFRQNGFQFWLKIWHPLKHAGLRMRLFKSLTSVKYFEVQIAEEQSSAVSISYFNGTGNNTVLEKKHMDHIIRPGSWARFTLLFKHGLIKLHLEGIPSAILSWKYFNENEIIPFQPYYLNFSLIDEGPLGISFNCNDSFPEILNNSQIKNVFYPLGIWKEDASKLENNITFFFRGNGSFSIKFYTLPFMGFDLRIDLNSGLLNNRIAINANVTNEIIHLESYYTPGNLLVINHDSWTNISIAFSEKSGQLFHNSSLVIDWVPPAPRNYLFFTVEAKGLLLWIANSPPPDIDGPRVHGSWTEWGPWECSRPCGGGLGTRLRTCTRPKPSYFGDLCNGEHKQTGECNTFECGQISPDTFRIINKRLQKFTFNTFLKKNVDANVSCYSDILEKIKEDSPKSKIYWYKNEYELTNIEAKHLDPHHFNWVLKKVTPNDTGTYICGTRVKHIFKPIQVTVIVVAADHFTATERSGVIFYLDCLNLQLSSIYGHLLQRWYHNDNLWEEHEMSQIFKKEKLRLTRNLSGIWRCDVVQRDLKATWTTNLINLSVLPPMSFFRSLIQGSNSSNSKSAHIGLMIFCGIMLIFTLVVIYFMVTAMVTRLPPKDYTVVAENEDDEYYDESSKE